MYNTSSCVFYINQQEYNIVYLSLIVEGATIGLDEYIKHKTKTVSRCLCISVLLLHNINKQVDDV